MRFLSDDRDDLALLGVLRSALFAIPDSVLLAAVKDAADAWEPLWKKVGRLTRGSAPGSASLPTASDARPLADAVDRLARYLCLADRLPAHELLALAVRESDLMLTLGVVDPSGRAIQNVEKLLDHARRCRRRRSRRPRRPRAHDRPGAQTPPTPPRRRRILRPSAGARSRSSRSMRRRGSSGRSSSFPPSTRRPS